MRLGAWQVQKSHLIMAGIIIILLAIIIFLTFNFAEPQGQFFGSAVWHGNKNEKVVALTFDDGPNPPNTDQVLEILKKYNVKATFFLVGKKVEQNPETAQKIVNEGHAIGNHTYSHLDLLLHNENDINKEIGNAEKVIIRVTGKRPRLFRPPHGFRDPLVYDVTEKKGYVVVLWSVMPWDWNKPGIKVIEKRVIDNTQNGSIILLHDGDADHLKQTGDRHQTVEALPTIIETLQKKGYRFVTIPELLKRPDLNR